MGFMTVVESLDSEISQYSESLLDHVRRWYGETVEVEFRGDDWEELYTVKGRLSAAGISSHGGVGNVLLEDWSIDYDQMYARSPDSHQRSRRNTEAALPHHVSKIKDKHLIIDSRNIIAIKK